MGKTRVAHTCFQGLHASCCWNEHPRGDIVTSVTNPTAIPDRFLGRYWRVPAFLDYVQSTLTEETVREAESQLAVQLPRVYLGLLKQQNGGYLRASWPESVSETLFGIGPRFPSITRDDGWWRPKNAESQMWAPPEPNLLIPFDGDGHWDMCFDYRKHGPRKEPSITFVDCECKRERPIVESFVDYLAGLVDESAETATRFYGPTSEVVAKRLSQHLGTSKPTVDTFAHGYPIWGIALPGESRWIWVSPNLVPSGFRRDQSRIIVTPDTALRIPEDPDCTALLSCTEESEASVLEALFALGLATR